MIKYIRTELSKGKKHGCYEVHKDGKHVGYLSKKETNGYQTPIGWLPAKFGWQADIETKTGQKIKTLLSFKRAKEYIRECLA